MSKLNRAKMHFYLVKYEKMHKNAKREFQRLTSDKKPASKAVNDLIKLIMKAMAADTATAIKILLEETE